MNNDDTTSDATHGNEILRYLALGDSYTIGESVAEEERWPVQLVARLRNRGVSIQEPQIIARTGWTTANLDRGIDDAVLDSSFAMVSLLISVNNQYQGRDEEDYRLEYRALLKRAIGLAKNDDASRVFVVSIPDWGVTPFVEGRDRAEIGAAIDRFNAICLEETRALGVVHIDITPISRGADKALVAPDGLHPSGAQYARWVEAILPAALAITNKDDWDELP